MASTFTLTLDTTAPAGVALDINSGASYATSQSVSAQPSTTDGVTTGYQMKIWGNVDTAVNANIQATEGASAWIAYSTSQAVTLSSGDGSKTLNTRIRDAVGNESSSASKSITLDSTVPVATVSTAFSPTTISKIATFRTSTGQFTADVAIQAWKVKVVPATNSVHTAGTQIPTTGGSTNVTGGALAASTPQSVSIDGADLETASSGDGDKIVKIFVQDLAGNWSTA
jgi:hypothetical protein